MMKDELTERELYQELWQGRDFEINHLWQRSIFLGAFMLAIAAGYGGLALKLLFPEYEEGASVGSTFFQQLAGAGLSYQWKVDGVVQGTYEVFLLAQDGGLYKSASLRITKEEA